MCFYLFIPGFNMKIPSCSLFTIALSVTLSACSPDKKVSNTEIEDTATGDSETDDSDASICEDEQDLFNITDIESHFETLSQDIDQSPTQTVLPEDTNGTLQLDLHPSVFSIMSGPRGIFAAASLLGDGRVVAFSGQDFIGSQDRSTLLEEENIARLVSNAVYWTGNSDPTTPPRVLVANEKLNDILEAAGISEVDMTPIIHVEGLWSFQDWSAQTLSGYDVIVVQVNEWGTLYVNPDEIDAIRDFVQSGGGLVIAGSALHYSWWLSYSADGFVGDLILDGSGIQWNIHSERDLSDATIVFDETSTPISLWCSYLDGDSLDDIQYAHMESLFDSAKRLGKEEQLDIALERMIAETPALPVSSDDPQARLSANVASALRPHSWPQVHPWASTFPGLPASDAVIEVLSTTVDGNYSGALPLGAYAPPGQVVTISIPDADGSRGLTIRVNELYDDNRNLDHIENWERAPFLLRDYAVTESETLVGNPYGGSISLVLPPGLDESIDVELSNAIPMAVYQLGSSTADEFDTNLGKGAPQAILQEKGRVRMVVAADAVTQVTSYEEVISFWSGFHSMHAQLASEPVPRMFESHWIFDVQVGWGYANATGDRITYPKLSEVWALRTQTGDEDWWLFGHELGHQFQTSNWSGGDITEVGVNLFTMYTLNYYIHGGGDYETIGFEPNTIDHAELESYRWETADLFGKLQLYRQLIFEFGWAPFQQTFASYYSENYPVSVYGEFMDGFAIRFSVVVEKDLVGFFEHWEYPMSSDAADTIQSFGFEPWLPPGW